MTVVTTTVKKIMPSERFFAEDTCALRENPTIIGVVERTWQDVDFDSIPDLDNSVIHNDVSSKQQQQFLRSTQPPVGYVYISFLAPHFASSLVRESALILLDRGLCFGDVVKKQLTDVESGTVVRISAECTLQPIYTGQPFTATNPWPHKEEDSQLYAIPGEELNFMHDYEEGNYIVYRNSWIGVITGIYEEVTVRLGNGSIVVVENADELEESKDMFDYESLSRTVSLGSNLERVASYYKVSNSSSSPIFYPGQLVSTKKGNLRRGQWKFGSYDPGVSPTGIIVDVRLTELDVEWLTPNVFNVNRFEMDPPSGTLGLDDLESGDIRFYDRFEQPRNSRNIKLPGSVRGSDIEIGDHVKFRDVAGAAVKYDGSTNSNRQHGIFRRISRVATQGYDMNTFVVKATKSIATIQWQDGSISDHEATALVPHLNVDDHDVWPGEIIALKTNQSYDPNGETIRGDATDAPSFIRPKKVGVVQSTDARERIARVRWFKDPEVGIFDEQKSVLLPGSSTGELSTTETQVSLYEIIAYPALSKARGDLVLIAPNAQMLALHTATALDQASSNRNIVPATLQAMFGRAIGFFGFNPTELTNLTPPQDTDWFGEVIDLGVDGRLAVRLGASREVRDVKIPIEQIIVVVSGDDASQIGSHDDSGEEWDDDDEGSNSMENYDSDDVIEETIEYEGGTRLDNDEGDDAWMTDDEGGDIASNEENGAKDPKKQPRDVSKSSTHYPGPTQPTEIGDTIMKDITSDEIWFSSNPTMPAQFTVLEGAPPSDHHFVHKTVDLSAHLMRRIMKEQKLMTSSLPGGVWVRTWEDRLDLLRVLIVGPRGTPYELAPFIIDFHYGHLFPEEPPDSYFHSWTNGLGRINPNLYENGKICLSLLGTWHAEEVEAEWSAERSSMLQVIVSLMGLVLVKEPYYNEAGFEILVGDNDSNVNSNLYSERARVMAKAFIARAITHQVGGLEDVIKWLYLAGDGPQLLQQSIKESRALLEDGEGEGNAERGSVPRLSSGAKILLRRHLQAMEQCFNKASAT
ncbi:MAG: hypothetical protein MMC33_002518 [Icmadophila ericetorum]|nr:hypothetical protein [Icmadophila ericetorum]